MAKKSDREKGPSAGLAEVAAAKRPRHRERDEDRTTLEMHQPDQILGSAAPDRLGEVLVTQGLITRHQLFNALNESYRASTTLREAIVALGYVDAATLDALNLSSSSGSAASED
jgi:hypothetical protein